MKNFIISSFILLSIILFLPSCSETTKKENNAVKPDSLIYNDKGELYTGTIKAVKYGKTIKYDVVNGVKHGAFSLYFENGKLEMEGQIKNNKNVGHWKYYYADGTIESQGDFENDLVVGEWKWYYPSGKLKETAVYKNGLRNGKLIMYNEEGKIISEKLFEGGVEEKNK